MSIKNPTWPDVMKFELVKNPILFDVGGYKGDWAQIAMDKYGDSIIYVFEPVKEFYNIIVERYKNNPNIKVFNFGLSDENRTEKISNLADASSVFFGDGGEEIELRDIREFLFEQSIFHVDLIKINIEGEEYRLLEHLIKHPELNVFENYLIQFHEYIENHIERRNLIVEEISKYYERIFNYEFIFEGWSMKKIQKINCFGDSHISIFSQSDDLIKENTPSITGSFNAFRFGPYLAYNLHNKSDVISNIKAVSKEENLLICFGEIDCRAQVKRICEETNRGYQEVIDEIVHNYFEVISGVNNKNTILFSITPELKEQPHWYYYKEHLEAFDCPRGTLSERAEYKSYFNQRVKEEADKLGLKYISIYDHVNGKDIYYLDDIHLAPKNVFYLIKREVIKNGLV